MKKKFFLKIICVFSLISVALIYMLNYKSTVSALDQPVHNPSTLKARMNIDIKDFSNEVSKKTISREEAINIAKKNINTHDMPVKIHAQRNLMTDDGITMNAISKKAKDANADLKSKSKFENIPVWIVSFEGLPTELRNGIILNEINLVIDAISGEPLYDFSYR